MIILRAASDGAPQMTQTWVDTDGRNVLINTVEGHQKVRNIERDQRVALNVANPDDPSRYFEVRGRVVETRPDDDLSVLDAFARKYLGGPFPRRKWSGRVVLVIEPSLVRTYRSPLSQKSAGTEPTGGS